MIEQESHSTDEGVLEGEVVIVNELGLHTRTATILVQSARKFASSIEVSMEGASADGKSLLELLTLGAGRGKVLRLRVAGPDRDEAFQTLARLIERGFQEEEVQ
ncbi:MAG TPA: HPr family phosphocarrier protein [Bdellovibrionota bacterium]|nr:HPr family phosphocarrier protein [Bdellovibrionota bacterium]